MTPLFGHEGAVAAFRDGLATGRLHHAWLVTGPAGIGKNLFAEKAALRLLAGAAGPAVDEPSLDVPDTHPIAKLFAAGSHPDYKRLERLTKESGTDLARSISVDQVRELQRLFSTTATFSPWRVVVIDAVDDLERAGANALLKSLEEPPPNSLFLLVSHAPERLLPTIRSRCRLLRLSRLEAGDMRRALAQAASDADVDEIEELAAAGQGSPGQALAFRGLDVAGLDRTMEALAGGGDQGNAARHALAQSLSGKAAQPRYEAFLARAPSFIASRARERRGAALGQAITAWQRAQDLASGAVRLSLDPYAVTFEISGLIASLAETKQAA